MPLLVGAFGKHPGWDPRWELGRSVSMPLLVGAFGKPPGSTRSTRASPTVSMPLLVGAFGKPVNPVATEMVIAAFQCPFWLGPSVNPCMWVLVADRTRTRPCVPNICSGNPCRPDIYGCPSPHFTKHSAGRLPTAGHVDSRLSALTSSCLVEHHPRWKPPALDPGSVCPAHRPPAAPDGNHCLLVAPR